RGNANRPLTIQGKAKRPTQTDHEQIEERPKDQHQNRPLRQQGNAKKNQTRRAGLKPKTQPRQGQIPLYESNTHILELFKKPPYNPANTLR
ncbi:hypothetical protein, partial [Paraburkholderia fungorum]|uniref:hypothetical protein n=1 Tax=Paraburkholderia fungorum TaxID=134537 RepID=UPI00248E8032